MHDVTVLLELNTGAGETDSSETAILVTPSDWEEWESADNLFDTSELDWDVDRRSIQVPRSVLASLTDEEFLAYSDQLMGVERRPE